MLAHFINAICFVGGVLATFLVLVSLAIYSAERKKKAKNKPAKIAVLTEFEMSWDFEWVSEKEDPLQEVMETLPASILDQLKKKPFPNEVTVMPGEYDVHLSINTKFYKKGTKPSKTAWERLEDDELGR